VIGENWQCSPVAGTLCIPSAPGTRTIGGEEEYDGVRKLGQGSAMHDSDDLQVFRQWVILRTLAARRHGMSIRELAEDRDVDRQTIRRDLKLLKSIGFPLVETEGEHGRKTWSFSGKEGCPPLQFTFDEAVALSLVRPFLEPLAGTELWEACHRAIRKVQATLSEEALAHFKKLQGVFHFTNCGFGSYASKAQIIDQLTLAIEDGNAIGLNYQSQDSTRPSKREVYPYKLVSHKGSLYLLGHAPAHNQGRKYKVDRIDSVDARSTRFPKPPEQEIARLLAGSFGIYDGDSEVKVLVKFQPSAARYVRELNWLPVKELTDQPDGTLLARFELTSTIEIESWVLGFGASAEALEPEALHKAVAEELEQLLDRYRRLLTTNN
jgi:predicted DNA-binding transcriptional regulator YafY